MDKNRGISIRAAKAVFAAFALLALMLCLSACGGSSAAKPTTTAPTASIQAGSSQITAGQPVAITWSSTNATSIAIDPAVAPAPLPASGSATVTPAATTTYNMTATGPGGSAASAVTVNVTAAQPAVTLVSSVPAITAGSSATLTWTSSNAVSVSFSPPVGTDPPALSGSATVMPAVTTIYTLTGTGAAGTTPATASVTINVVAPGTALSPITHLIIVMMQNRSFDNLFGTYPMANGFNPQALGYNQVDAQGKTVSPTLLPNLISPPIQNLLHDTRSYTASYDGGKMDKFAFTNGDVAMQYYDSSVMGTADDGKPFGINTLWGYAQQYTLSDNFYPSAMDSEPANILYMTAATVHDTLTANSYPALDKCSVIQQQQNGGTIAPALTTLTNIGDQMNANHVSWTWYMENFNNEQNSNCADYVPQENAFQYFANTANSANLLNFVPADFQTSLANGTLPSVLWITPAPIHSMHPGSGNVANGIEWLDNLVQSVKSSPAWPSTAIIVLWDESGGWYDHVPPPQLVLSVPDPPGLGARVPVILISPFAKAGVISHQQMDFVSILRFIQWNWGLGILTDPTQSAREMQTGDLCDLLTIPCASP
ncbi:MAG: alkaline phosphatase family protein [Acidobacteriaceae bacterium]